MKAELLLLRDLANRKWILIGCRNLKKGAFNPISEHSGKKLHQPIMFNPIGWMPDNEALSLVSCNTKKGASILLSKLPAIIRLVTGWPKHVTGIRSKKCYG